ncbi:oxidoreductase [Legionella hackeliae]|uniref:Flagellin modification protein A n=1 Tax=Legionella hackeliae TaxID=449 RepID=A0A0A8UMY1_LEGHA|nr:oxidoreductase [Legionella hackeliae]KTD08797.1 3-oxoacyl-ACP reductase [Legionella hackeliae]CEK10225.1 Flagellin modification protein A [Legionella hackeliae]STX46954.1 3-oxoacyl-ACP reductase [Legionella hackeliae]
MLKGKKIVVAGSGGLLGSQTVKQLLLQNANVLAVDNNYQGMIDRLVNQDIDISHSQLTLMPLDLTNEQEVTGFFNDVTDLDGAVNCTYPRNKNYGRDFLEVKLNDFNENVNLHLGAAFLFTQQCAAYFLREKKWFSLVNIASIYGVIAPKFTIYEHTPMTMPVEYAAIKSAIIHLNKYVASYVANSNFRINSVSPGGIFDNQPSSFLEAYKKNSLGRGMLDVNEVTGAILFLLSDFSKYINGQNLIVDDGFSL